MWHQVDAVNAGKREQGTGDKCRGNVFAGANKGGHDTCDKRTQRIVGDEHYEYLGG